MRTSTRGIVIIGCLLCLLVAPSLFAAQLQVLLPLERVAYQTNEQIAISVVRSDEAALPAAELTLTVTGDNASTLVFSFPLKAVTTAPARTTEHYHINGWLLRPGKYTVEAAAHGATAAAPFEVYSHERRTSYKLINWGRAAGVNQLPNGEDGFGFNLNYAHYGGHDQNANIRSGQDYMPNCTMSGGHQMDLRIECDWSDPYVLSGGRARVARKALIDRKLPNCLGIHFYDEPGLTWYTDQITNQMSNNSVPAQLRSFKAAFGYDVPHYASVDPTNAEQAQKWLQFLHFKAGLMEAAWADAKFAIDYIKPDFLSVTQSQYGWSAFSDGYYFNITRDLQVTSGHGGYHDWGPGYWHPSFTLEVARARDFTKPTWYLPAWYGNTTSDHFRLEQYLSFQTNIQGMISPPDVDPVNNPGARSGITESNKLMGNLGTIFTTMPVTRGPVGILYSISHLMHANLLDRGKYYAHTDKHGEFIHISYIATKLMQVNSQFVLDEDIVDGTILDGYRAIIIPAVDFLAPEVIAALERFTAAGGAVILTSDCAVKINGATVLPIKAGYTEEGHKKADELNKKAEEMEKANADPKDIAAVKTEASMHVYGLRASILAAQPMAKAMKPVFDKVGIVPVLISSDEGISATVQSHGDVDYVFAVNAAHDFSADASPMLGIKRVKATIGLKDDGRPIYDAVRGGMVAELSNKANGLVSGDISFGPGQMRAFARTTRPIGKVLVPAPVIARDLTLEQSPLQVSISGMVLAEDNTLLVGSFPLRIRVIDPLGAVRYDLYRATRDGILRLPLQLAANDPAGAWTVQVSELLNNTTGSAVFNYQPLAQKGAMAGALDRAVYFGNDRQNILRFFRVNKNLTLITGSSEYSAAAATRLAESLKPWGVKCTIATAAAMNKPEPDPVDDWLVAQYTHMGKKTTWAGPGGFDVPGPSVLIGNPEDNPLIKSFNDWGVLTYKVTPDFPGAGRGMIAWQLDCVRQGYESITAIAYDDKGMDEAIGSLYQAAAAVDPINPYIMPANAAIVAASQAALLPEATIAWKVNLPDLAVAIAVEGGQTTVTTHDGTVSVLDNAGKIVSTRTTELPVIQAARVAPNLPEVLKPLLINGLIAKDYAANGDLHAITYWGGTLQVVNGADGTIRCRQLLPNDISAIAWSGANLVAVLADGQTYGLTLP